MYILSFVLVLSYNFHVFPRCDFNTYVHVLLSCDKSYDFTKRSGL